MQPVEPMDLQRCSRANGSPNIPQPNSSTPLVLGKVQSVSITHTNTNTNAKTKTLILS